MMPDFDNPMDRDAMELDADRIMKTKATGNSLEKKESKHVNDTLNKSFTMPLKQMSAGCSICGKMSQNGVGGICKGCWNQFQEKGVRIGNISEFEQFTEAVKKQVSRIITIGSDDKNNGGQEKLIENIRQIVPAIFTKQELEQPESKRALCLDNDLKPKVQISPTKPGITRSKTFAYLKQDEGAKNKDTSKAVTSPTKVSKIKRATTGITVKSSMQDRVLSSRKSTTAISDKRSSHRDNAPSTSSSTASQKEVYTPITIDKSKYLAVSLEQIEQRNRQMQINKSRSSKVRSKDSKGHSHRKKSSKNDPTQIGGMMYGRGNAMKRMAYDKKRHHSGSDDDDEDDDLDNVPSYASQDKLNMARTSSSSNSRSETPSKSFDQFDYGSRQVDHKPIQNEPYTVEKYGLYTEKDKEREQQPTEVLGSLGMTREPDQPGSSYYQKPGISTAISNFMSHSDYFMPSNPEVPSTQDDAYWGESPVKAANSVAIMEHAEAQKTPENYYADTKPKILESNDYTSYKMGNINNAVTNSSIYAVEGTRNTTKKRDFAFGGGENITASKGIEHKEDLSSNLYTIAKQFPVAALQVQEAYFEPFSGRNTPNPMLQMAAIGGVNLVKKEAKVDKTEDYYTGGFGPTKPTSAVVTNNQYTAGDLAKKDDFFNAKTDSIYAADKYSLSKETSCTSHTSNDNSYFGSETNVKSLTSSLYTELKPAGTASDCYTGALFHAPQLIAGVGFTKENRMGIDDRVVQSATNESDIGNPSNILGPSLSSGHSDTPQETKRSNRMFRKQRYSSIDSIFENSIASTGEFFSKAITSFGNNNGNSNYGYSASEAICGTNAYNEDQMDFGELARKKSNDYVDWDPRLKPKFGVMNKEPRRPVRTLDFSKYKLYDFVGNDAGSTGEQSKRQESPWYNSHDEGSYGGQRNTTWDGRAWPIEKPTQAPARRSESADAYTDMPDCRICPNNNNSYSSMSCFGNMNNNYPNYEMYDKADNTPRREPQPQRPASNDNDYAPYMYGNPAAAASQERQRPRQETPRRVAQTQGGFMDDTPYFGLNTCSSLVSDYADYADSPPPEQLRVVREPSPPRPPKVIKVGDILVRNNVENNDDYAENVNRDLGEDSSSFGGMAFNQDLNHQGKAFAYQTSQSLVSEPANLRQIMDVHKALERERSVPKSQQQPLRRERSLQRESLKPTVHNNDTKKPYSNTKYDDGEDRKSWAQERKSLTDVRKTSQESRKTTRDVQKSYKPSAKPNSKPKRSASMGRESSYVQHRPSAGGDHGRSAKPHQPREERSYKKERPQHVYYKKDDKKKEEEKKTNKSSWIGYLNPLNAFRSK